MGLTIELKLQRSGEGSPNFSLELVVIVGALIAIRRCFFIVKHIHMHVMVGVFLSISQIDMAVGEEQIDGCLDDMIKAEGAGMD